jgi:ABC-2 type transport system ATP-binding protein
VIEVEGVTKVYGDLTAVQSISFSVQRGEVVGFLGPNGAGKTTTMRIVTGYLPPTAGTVKVGGYDLLEQPIDARRGIGYLPEMPPVYPEMRVRDYVAYVARINDVPRRDVAARVDHAIAVCALDEVRNRVIGSLSRGFRQRVGLAQAIVHEPDVLVLDEPTAGLDPLQVREIRRLIKALSEEEGRTVLLSTHILPEVEAICRRVLLISDGQIRLDGPLEEIRGTGTLEDVFIREASAPEAAQSNGGGDA